MDEFESARIRHDLRARLDMGWERLEDVVSELIELHQIDIEEIVDRVEHFAQDKEDGTEEAAERSV